MWRLVRVSACYTHYNIFLKNKNKKRDQIEELQRDFRIYQQCRKSLSERKEAQDTGSENKNHTTAFQVVQKQVQNKADFLPGCSTSPQFLKPSNSMKTWSILSYRSVHTSLLHIHQTTKAKEEKKHKQTNPHNNNTQRNTQEWKHKTYFKEFSYSSKLSDETDNQS